MTKRIARKTVDIENEYVRLTALCWTMYRPMGAIIINFALNPSYFFV